MNRTDATSWVLCLCAGGLRRSQAKTLSALVWGAVSMSRASLAELGRCLSVSSRTMTKHAIKRVWPAHQKLIQMV